MAEKKDIVLDDDAQRLFAELGGLDVRPRAKEVLIRSSEGLAEALGQEEKQIDGWRVILTDFTYYLALGLVGYRMPAGAATIEESLGAMVDALKRLQNVPNYQSRVKIRFRGLGLFQDGEVNQKLDYVASVGNVMLDIPLIKAAAKRGGLPLSHIPGRLQKAFEHLASLEINLFQWDVGKLDSIQVDRLGQCLRILRRYYTALDQRTPPIDEEGPPALVKDEYHRPNPNLTMVAGLNRLSHETISNLVKKVGALMNRPDAPGGLDGFASSFEAFFAFKNLREQLVRPPIEINNLRWLVASRDQSLASAGEIRVARKVMEKLGGATPAAAQVVDAIYGEDYPQIDAGSLGRRMTSVSRFLDQVDQASDEAEIRQEVLSGLEKRLDQVDDTVLMNLVLPETQSPLDALSQTPPARNADDVGLILGPDGSVSTMGPERTLGEEPPAPSGVPFEGIDYSAIGRPAGDAPRPVKPPALGDVTKTVYDNLFAGVGIERLADGGLQRTDRAERTGLNEKLGDLLSFFRNRSGTRKKIKQMLRQSVEFDERDFQVIARDFDVTPESAAQLLGLLKSCFSKDGRFLRAAFERNIPAFAQYERKVFQFLWQYLKDITFREDRVAFLNALQLLISRLKQPNLALHVLLDDLVQRPDQVAYSDRNALILSNILVRRYNKELTNDVEVTPEEVLLVRDGLDKEIVKDVSARLDREQEGFFIKVRALHRAFKESLDPPESGSVMPIRYLATLEREAYIFLSLVGGNTAHTVVRSAVKEYGNPDAEIYHLKKSPMSLKVNLQLLQVTMRGVIRFGDPDDLGLLKHVRGRLNAFLALKKATDYHEMVRRVMRWAGTD